MKFWILLAAVIGYLIPDLWDSMLIWAKFRPVYPFTIFVVSTSPGWLFFRSRLAVGLVNAVIYGVVAYFIALGAKKCRRQLRSSPAELTPS